MLTSPSPGWASGSSMPGAVVLHFEDQATGIGHRKSHDVGRRPGVLAGVGQTFAHDGQNVVAHRLGHGVVDGTLEAHLGPASEISRHLVGETHDCLTQPARQSRVPQLEDGRADLGDGVVEVVDGLGDPFDDQVPLGQARRALKTHADGVDALDDPVVQIAGDAVTVVEHAHDADAVVQPGVLDGDAGGEREGFGKGFVLVAESRSILPCPSGRGCRRRRLGRAVGRPGRRSSAGVREGTRSGQGALRGARGEAVRAR